MVDKEVDEVVNETIKLIKEDIENLEFDYLYDEDDDYMDAYFLNKKEYIKYLINGEITNNQRKIHDLIEEYKLTDNKKFMIKLVQLDSYALRYASEKLKDEVVLQVEKIKILDEIKETDSCIVIVNASEKLRNDKEVMLEAVKRNGAFLVYASKELKNDKEVVINAVKQDGCALKFVSKELQNDKEVVLKAVKQNGYALQYANEEMKNNKDVVINAVKQQAYALQYASEELKNNKEVVINAVRQNGYVLKEVSEELKNDKNIVIEAMKQNFKVFHYASKKLQNDDELKKLYEEYFRYWMF